ncbi:MAG: hypothetical protein AAGF74_04315 [Pseudomonadota bacterium]
MDDSDTRQAAETSEPSSRANRPPMLVAGGISLVWLALCAAYFYVAPASDVPWEPLTVFAVAVAIVLPLFLIWMAAGAAQALNDAQADIASLEKSNSDMRRSYLNLQQEQTMPVRPADPSGEVPTETEQSEAFATFATRRARRGTEKTGAKPQPPAQNDSEPLQAPLPLETPARHSGAPVTVEDFIIALNFPKTAEDEEGFLALRRALADPHVNRLIHASQDVLTLMSQEGIYMDDLAPDLARPEVWRRFADGERGRTVAMLGGVRDRSALTLAAQRMRRDHIFRDAAHHFLRQFDKSFAAFAETATDEEIVRLSDTRSARAFMLLGRVAGTFD